MAVAMKHKVAKEAVKVRYVASLGIAGVEMLAEVE